MLKGKTALVTGSTSGIGLGIAKGLARQGAHVVLNGFGDSQGPCAEVRAAAAQAGHDVRVEYHGADMSRPADIEDMMAFAARELGRVDILVNNAGIGTAVPATKETPEQFREVIDINLSGCYWMAQACGKVMQPGSSVINISSVLALTTAGLPQAAYAASKSGLLGLTRDLAQQWARRKGIRVNAIAPGFFPTEMTDEYLPGYLESLQHRILLGRMGELPELAATVVFLASPAAGYITGQAVVVDGGVTIA